MREDRAGGEVGILLGLLVAAVAQDDGAKFRFSVEQDWTFDAPWHALDVEELAQGIKVKFTDEAPAQRGDPPRPNASPKVKQKTLRTDPTKIEGTLAK